MIDKSRRDDALAAEYVVGTLQGQARVRFQKRLQSESKLVAAVLRWESLLVGLNDRLDPVTPPDSVWQNITRSLPTPNTRFTLRPFIPWLAAASIAAMIALSVVIMRPLEQSQLAILSDANHNELWRVTINTDHNRLTVIPLQTVAVAAGKSLQLWLIPAGRKPESLGLVPDNTPLEIALENPAALTHAVLAVSLEPQGGSPTGQPTGPVLYSVGI